MTSSAVPLGPQPGPRFRARWLAVPAVIALDMLGFGLGAGVSERQAQVDGEWLARLYQTLSLFVFGGIDLGSPVGGTALARACLWLAYFSAPLVTASAVVEAIINIVRPTGFLQIRKRDHIVIVGSGELATAFLRRMTTKQLRRRVLLVDSNAHASRLAAMAEAWGVHSQLSEFGHPALVRQLGLDQAARVILLADEDLGNFDIAAAILDHHPPRLPKIIVHASDLRMLETFKDSAVGQGCEVFNTYNLAASAFLRQELVPYFESTPQRDVLVLAGFGRFGQTVFHELRQVAAGLATIGLIDFDMDQKLRIADDAQPWRADTRRVAVDGDIRDPAAWVQLAEAVQLSQASPVIVLATGSDEENARAALALARRYPAARIYVRTHRASRFVEQAGEGAQIQALGIVELMGAALPSDWYRPEI